MIARLKRIPLNVSGGVGIGEVRIEPGLTRPVRLLMVVDSLQVGGGERQVVSLAGTLQHKGYEVSVACSTDGVLSGALDRQGVPVHILMDRLVKRRVSLRYAWAFRRLIRAEAFDLIHAHVYASAAAASIATLRIPVPLILSQHSEATWRGPVALGISRWTYSRGQHVIAVSNPIRDRLIEEGGVAPERVSVIPNAITPLPDYPAPAHVQLPSRWRRGTLAGMVARLEPEKGVRVLLEALPGLLASQPDCHFIVVGDGPLRSQMEGRVDGLGLTERVHFLGFQPDARPIIAHLDLLVVPSLSEGTPLVVLEAMSTGVPVVATRVGGIPEQIRHGQEGLLVPTGEPDALREACLNLLQDRPTARRLGEAGRVRAESHFDHESMVRRIEHVYQTVLARSIVSQNPVPR